MRLKAIGDKRGMKEEEDHGLRINWTTITPYHVIYLCNDSFYKSHISNGTVGNIYNTKVYFTFSMSIHEYSSNMKILEYRHTHHHNGMKRPCFTLFQNKNYLF